MTETQNTISDNVLLLQGYARESPTVKVLCDTMQPWKLCLLTHTLLSYVIVPYLSILKLGSNTRRGSNICQVVQQNERNNRLGPFKRWVPKLLNLITLKLCQTLRKISLFLIPLLMYASPFWMLLQSIVYSLFITFVAFQHQDALTSFTTPGSK